MASHYCSAKKLVSEVLNLAVKSCIVTIYIVIKNKR